MFMVNNPIGYLEENGDRCATVIISEIILSIISEEKIQRPTQGEPCREKGLLGELCGEKLLKLQQF